MSQIQSFVIAPAVVSVAVLQVIRKTLVLLLLIAGSVKVSGQALVSYKDPKTEKYGFKDGKGKIVVAPAYDTVEAFVDNLAVVGKRITFSDFNYGLINQTGKTVAPVKYTSVYVGGGFIVVEGYEKGSRLNGLLDKTGKVIAPLKYTYIGDINNGMARVGFGGKYGYVDRTGKLIIPIKYDYIYSSDNGLVIAGRDDKYFLVDRAGKEKPLDYERIGFKNYNRLLVKQGGKYGFINTKAEVVIPIIYENAYDFNDWQRTGYLSNVRRDSRSGFIDTSGKEVIAVKYNMAGLFREGLASVTNDLVPAVDSKNGYVDSTGTLVIPMIYNAAEFFSEGLAAVSKKAGGRNFSYGYIDATGKEVIPFTYESAEPFSEGLAAVKKNGKYGFIDRSGKEVIAFIYDRVIRGFSGNYAKVVLNGRTITINKTGKEL